jgi:membrane protease YdiL (CAAX protease family)
MTMARASRPGFWSVLFLLLGAARLRAVGRRKRQVVLLSRRSGKGGSWAGMGSFFTLLLVAFLNAVGALLVMSAVNSGERVEIERNGAMAVSPWFRDWAGQGATEPKAEALNKLDPQYAAEARELAQKYGGEPNEIEDRLRQNFAKSGARGYVASDVTEALPELGKFGSLPAMFGSLALLLWSLMLVFQSEGLELDTQRRRHPMWEWLFSHPSPASAIFLAEMLSPLAANPIFYSVPLFPWILYGSVYGVAPGLLAAVVVGAPVAVAAACLGKALEIGIMLRFSPRSRGAMIGIMSWAGFASTMLIFMGAATVGKSGEVLARLLEPLTVIPWPWLGIFLGQRADGSFSLIAGMLNCWFVAAVVVAGSVGFCIWGARRGLSGQGSSGARRAPSRSAARFAGKDPLYRKELLWFTRDSSAVIQAVLIPLTMAGVQLFNLRSLTTGVFGAWHYLCGAAVIFGTYLLTVLGPRSLLSEGPALWIALTWPRGLESLLKAKARLWALISSALVAPILLYAAWLYPGSLWKIALVGLGWFIFARSLAEKTVTVAKPTTESGETAKISWGMRWAVSLGTMSFSIGVLSQQWALAVVGVVYSTLTAAAMWQNFRARLPYLYDPWSETMPPAPSLMHAMIAISALVEGGMVLLGLVLVWFGRENLAVSQTLVFGVGSVIVALVMADFLRKRGVGFADIWLWRDSYNVPAPSGLWRRFAARNSTGLALSLLAASVLGLGFGLSYVELLHRLPATSDMLKGIEARQATIPHLQVSLFILGVFLAPLTEEFLFHGLLYRALDREWGGWRALLGSAAFFAIYHPVLAWAPVGLLGLLNALLFKKTGRLAPAVLLHMVYNLTLMA